MIKHTKKQKLGGMARPAIPKSRPTNLLKHYIIIANSELPQKIADHRPTTSTEEKQFRNYVLLPVSGPTYLGASGALLEIHKSWTPFPEKAPWTLGQEPLLHGKI